MYASILALVTVSSPLRPSACLPVCLIGLDSVFGAIYQSARLSLRLDGDSDSAAKLPTTAVSMKRFTVMMLPPV